VPLHHFIGGDATSGKGTRYLVPNGENAVFVIYCRKCHRGLCSDIEIGTADNGKGKKHNVIFVEPCQCLTEVIPYPEKYQEAARDPREHVGGRLGDEAREGAP